MKESLDIVCSAHHASSDFGEFSNRCALTKEELIRFSDYGTADTVPRTGLAEPLIATHSRGIIDLNRAPNDRNRFPEQDFGRPTAHKIWKDGQELTSDERQQVTTKIYDTYHKNLMDTISGFRRAGLVVAWDNTANYEISNAATSEREMMPSVILSNRGTRDEAGASSVQELSARGEQIHDTSCSPHLLEEFSIELRKTLKAAGLPDDVFLNRVYKGGYIAEHYNTFRHSHHFPVEVHSFQVEYNTALTHTQDTLEADRSKIEKLRIATEKALTSVYANLLTWN